MANEATVTSSLQIRKGSLEFASRPGAFKADVSGTKGPTPGAVGVTASGTDVSLAQLTTPGLCFIQNLSDTYWMEVGPYATSTSEFYPLLELGPGEFVVVRLSRFLGTEMGTVPGTGTSGVGVTLRLTGVGGAVDVVVAAFER